MVSLVTEYLLEMLPWWIKMLGCFTDRIWSNFVKKLFIKVISLTYSTECGFSPSWFQFIIVTCSPLTQLSDSSWDVSIGMAIYHPYQLTLLNQWDSKFYFQTVLIHPFNLSGISYSSRLVMGTQVQNAIIPNILPPLSLLILFPSYESRLARGWMLEVISMSMFCNWK